MEIEMKSFSPALWRCLILVLILAVMGAPGIYAAPGSLDTSFAYNGLYSYETGTYYSWIRSTAIQPDGRIVFAGYSNYGDAIEDINYPTLERLLPDGSPDPSFGSNGAIRFPFRGEFNSVTLQPDGKLVMAGTSPRVNGAHPKYLLVRCNADGTLDASFNQTGMITGVFETADDFNIGSGTEALVRSDGKIVIAGKTTHGFAAAQYTASGLPDTSFGVNGRALIHIDPPFSPTAALQRDGKITFGAGPDFVLARILRNGSVDTSFGNQGVVRIHRDPYNYELNSSIRFQPDGKIVVAGTISYIFHSYSIAILRFNSNGSLDPSFGTGGVVQTEFNSTGSRGYDLDLQPNGKIVVTGLDGNAKLDTRRFYPNGSPDFTFGQSGLSVPQYGVYGRRITVLKNGDMIVSLIGARALHMAVRIKGRERAGTVRFDYDDDGKADISGFRPSNSNWNLLQSEAGSTSIHWGLPTDVLVPADYDGDGKTNVAVYRDGVWKILWSDGSYHQVYHGDPGDLPRPGDFDGDGKADIALWRPSNGNWYWINSSDGRYKSTHFGTNGDVPLIADFDGDGQTDLAVFRPSEGNWYYLKSSDGQYAAAHFGTTGDIPVVGDFDGDGKTDLSVFRPSNSFWYRLNSSNGQYFAQKFGTAGDVPVAADYDGDNKADLAVFRPSNSVWYILKSSNGLTGTLYGSAGDKPVPSVFLP
jgi:uncharacterized delta-60 repeat protein